MKIKSEDRAAYILRDRVRAAEGDLSKLEAVERQITRHYNNGTLTANELTQLDAMVMALSLIHI